MSPIDEAITCPIYLGDSCEGGVINRQETAVMRRFCAKEFSENRERKEGLKKKVGEEYILYTPCQIET